MTQPTHEYGRSVHFAAGLYAHLRDVPTDSPTQASDEPTGGAHAKVHEQPTAGEAEWTRRSNRLRDRGLG